MARKVRYLLFLFPLCASLSTMGQDSTYVRRLICDLSAPEMYGRGMQHRGDSIAADYLRQELRTLGVKPLTENYFQYFLFPNTTERPPIVKAGYRSQNVCGIIPGKSDTMIVFSAHYEHAWRHHLLWGPRQCQWHRCGDGFGTDAQPTTMPILLCVPVFRRRREWPYW